MRSDFDQEEFWVKAHRFTTCDHGALLTSAAVSEDRWILNDEHWEQIQHDDQRAPDTADAHAEILSGRDDAGVVTVDVTPDGDVVAVHVVSGWKGTVEPTSLNEAVLAAANAATAEVLSTKMEGFDPEAETTGSTARSGPADPGADESRITADDAMRLLDAVTADLGDFMRRFSAVADQPARVESSGGHVTVTGQRGQITSVEIDAQWAGSARDSEIESEVTETLKTVNEKSALGELANGPRSRNIDELKALASDPQALMRRVGLTPVHSPNDRGE